MGKICLGKALKGPDLYHPIPSIHPSSLSISRPRRAQHLFPWSFWDLKQMAKYSTVGVFIREKLADVADNGIVIADPFREFKDSGRTKATYCSFARYFHLYKKLGYVEETGEREPAWNPQLSDRKYFRITAEGVDRISEWGNPLAELVGRENWRTYMHEWRKTHAAGRPRGRPGLDQLPSWSQRD